ncbi:endo-1,6-alpha-mannosidase [Pleurotus eryngii]|uniref:Endo-1,6-alpha-mannosidase n=1 Tax=Pleurotus eryngii TaxID=5323 RepID=A0A9P6A6Z3_PLEER|nr:endo-1,6-alpha-mannosidase [Pleurotus eryngii]
MYSKSIVVALALCGYATAQDFGVPLSWRKFSNTRPLNERISIAQAAINAILPQLNSATAEFNGIGFWQSGNVWSVLANQDRIAGSTVNQARVIANLNTAFRLNANYDKFHSTTTRCGGQRPRYMPTEPMGILPCYPMPCLVNLKRSSVITPAQASAGRHPAKSFTLAGTCDGKSMAGGVFWRPTADDQGVNSVTTGYAPPRSFLAEITGDQKYTNAAIQSANWMRSLNINSKNLALDTVNAHDCSRSPDGWIFTYNSGKLIEGLGVLSHVTGDNQWDTLMANVLIASTKGAPWQGSNGVITEGSSPNSNNDGVSFKSVLIRGLHEAFERSSNNDLRILVHSYVDVQYNALLDLAANGSTYSSRWAGPPQGFTTWGQLAALDVMTSAINAN